MISAATLNMQDLDMTKDEAIQFIDYSIRYQHLMNNKELSIEMKYFGYNQNNIYNLIAKLEKLGYYVVLEGATLIRIHWD